MRALIFGAKGSIGNYIFNELGKEQIIIIGTTSNPDNVSENIILVKNDNLDNLIVVDPFDIVIWANGEKCNDNINTYDESIFGKIIDANVTFILNTLHCLMLNNKIKKKIIFWTLGDPNFFVSWVEFLLLFFYTKTFRNRIL